MIYKSGIRTIELRIGNVVLSGLSFTITATNSSFYALKMV